MYGIFNFIIGTQATHLPLRIAAHRSSSRAPSIVLACFSFSSPPGLLIVLLGGALLNIFGDANAQWHAYLMPSDVHSSSLRHYSFPAAKAAPAPVSSGHNRLASLKSTNTII